MLVVMVAVCALDRVDVAGTDSVMVADWDPDALTETDAEVEVD